MVSGAKTERKTMNIMAKTRISVEEFRKRNESARKARAVDGGDRDLAVINGVKKYAIRFEQAGDPKMAAKLRKYADQLEGFLKTESDMRAAIVAVTSDPVGAAVRTAMVELVKKLPACFPTDEDAECFARTLPLLQAKRAEAADADKRHKAAQATATARHSFRDLMELAAVEATGEVYANKAVLQLQGIGL
jgi:hypothetical protein